MTAAQGRGGYWWEAQEFVDAGDIEGAIDALVRANRLTPKAKRERRILQLRHRAAENVQYSEHPEPWPVPYPDPFPADQAVPEIPARALTTEVLGGALQHRGLVIARGLLDWWQVRLLRNAIDASLNARLRALKGAPDENGSQWYAPLVPRSPGILEGVEWVTAADSPRGAFLLTEMLEPWTQGVIKDYLGERPIAAADKWTLRRISPDCEAQWHQDGAFLGGEVRVVNVWLALSRCGGEAPAAGFWQVPARLDMLESGTEGAAKYGLAEPVVERAAAAAGVEILDPVYEPGDAVFMDQFTAHNTGHRPGLSEYRYAVESWFFAGSTYSDTRGATVLV